MINLFDYSSSSYLSKDYAQRAFRRAGELFPICRSITGPGLRYTLSYIKDILPDLLITHVDSGSKVFDWTIPDEWSIDDAFILDPSGKKIVDFQECNLHVVGYSSPINTILSLDELLPHLHSLPDQPTAIPYVTSYYKKRWGFCVSDEFKNSLAPGDYKVVISSSFSKGYLSYGELYLPSTQSASAKTIFFSSYICHPSMANNELSGPVTLISIAEYLSSLSSRRFNYQFIFIPETIGAIAYLSNNLETLKRDVIAGFNITCVGDERAYSFLPSRSGQSLADQVLKTVLDHYTDTYTTYSWSSRGSDERQYCWPGVDIPVASFMRSKYGEYPEYHTSLDKLGTVVTVNGLTCSFDVIMKTIELLENNYLFQAAVLCEPQLSPRGLYSDLSIKTAFQQQNIYLEILTYCDGATSLIDICNQLCLPPWEVYPYIRELISKDLLKV